MDEERWKGRAHYSESWCGVIDDCAFLTVEYFDNSRAKMFTLHENQMFGEPDRSDLLCQYADRMARVIRIIRRDKPYAAPEDIQRVGSPNPKIVRHARQIATEAHKGQKDKAGKDYILHPLRVAERCKSTNAKVVALLHDTIEDSYVTPEFLRSEGFSEEIIDGVLSVTRREGESYEDFISRAAKNHIGKEVKLADLEDNMDIRRLNELTEESVDRLKKYLSAWQYLNNYGK